MKHRTTGAAGSVLVGFLAVTALLTAACTPGSGGATTPPAASLAPAASAAPADAPAPSVAAPAPSSSSGKAGYY